MEWPMTMVRSRPSDAKQRARVPGELLEGVLVMRGFGRFAEPDLIRSDDAVTARGQSRDGVLPSGGAEILAVQQHGGFTIRGRRRLHVEVGHIEGFALRRE